MISPTILRNFLYFDDRQYVQFEHSFAIYTRAVRNVLGLMQKWCREYQTAMMFVKSDRSASLQKIVLTAILISLIIGGVKQTSLGVSRKMAKIECRALKTTSFYKTQRQ